MGREAGRAGVQGCLKRCRMQNTGASSSQQPSITSPKKIGFFFLRIRAAGDRGKGCTNAAGGAQPPTTGRWRWGEESNGPPWSGNGTQMKGWPHGCRHWPPPGPNPGTGTSRWQQPNPNQSPKPPQAGQQGRQGREALEARAGRPDSAKHPFSSRFPSPWRCMGDPRLPGHLDSF